MTVIVNAVLLSSVSFHLPVMITQKPERWDFAFRPLFTSDPHKYLWFSLLKYPVWAQNCALYRQYPAVHHLHIRFWQCLLPALQGPGWDQKLLEELLLEAGSRKHWCGRGREWEAPKRTHHHIFPPPAEGFCPQIVKDTMLIHVCFAIWDDLMKDAIEVQSIIIAILIKTESVFRVDYLILRAQFIIQKDCKCI